MKTYLAIFLVGVALGAALILAIKKPNTPTVVQTERGTEEQSKTVTVKTPDGTVTSTTTVHKQTKELVQLPRPKKMWQVTLNREVVGRQKDETTLSVNKRILGNVFMGGSISDKGSVGINIGVEF